MLVDLATGHEYLRLLDGYSGYNKIFIGKECTLKMVFRCPCALGTCEWAVISFGLKNAKATYQKAMNFMLHDFINTLMKVYIDDIVVKSSLGNCQLDHI